MILGMVAALGSYLVWPIQFANDMYLSVLAALLLTAAASFSVAGLVGLLFGIPRSFAERQLDGVGSMQVADGHAEQSRHFLPNTNLEQVSDWLTKILIGAGLVQLKSLGGAISHLASYLSPALGGTAATPAFTTVVIVFNLACGFCIGYIMTRVLLATEFELAAGQAVLPDSADRPTDDERDAKRRAENG